MISKYIEKFVGNLILSIMFGILFCKYVKILIQTILKYNIMILVYNPPTFRKKLLWTQISYIYYLGKVIIPEFGIQLKFLEGTYSKE